VATAAPGDAGYNGGRWRVHGLSFTDYEAAVKQFDTNSSGDLDSTSEVEAALWSRHGQRSDQELRVSGHPCPLTHE
jgi:hypothetical protein